MISTNQDATPTNLRKIGPTAKPPATSLLAALSAADRRLVRRRLTEPVECVYDPQFDDPHGEEQMLALVAPLMTPRAGGSNNDDSGLDWLAIPDMASLAGAREHDLFRWLNYCRYRTMRVIQHHAGKRLTANGLAELLRWERAASQARELLVRVNVPLVLAMAKRTRVTGVDFAELVSEGNLALLRSVEKFDCARGYKFSTYACRAILKAFSRVGTRAARRRGHFPTEFDPTLEQGDLHEQRRATAEEECLEELRCALEQNLADLSAVEEQVIRARFALENTAAAATAGAKTLEEVGEMIGVTKERVRQIQNKALAKLRQYLEDGELRR